MGEGEKECEDTTTTTTTTIMIMIIMMMMMMMMMVIYTNESVFTFLSRRNSVPSFVFIIPNTPTQHSLVWLASGVD